MNIPIRSSLGRFTSCDIEDPSERDEEGRSYILIPKGTRITPVHIRWLADCGFETVDVDRYIPVDHERGWQ